MQPPGGRLNLAVTMTRWLISLLAAFWWPALFAAVPPALLDWSDSERYRTAVTHPSGAIKAGDLVRARENLRRYPWARSYAENLERTARTALAKLSPAYLESMIPETTPGDAKFTPCPACRDQGKPVHPHGLWTWREAAPDELVCTACRTTFPNDRYPESVTLRTTWGKPQTLTYAGGEPFVIFTYRRGGQVSPPTSAPTKFPIWPASLGRWLKRTC